MSGNLPWTKLQDFYLRLGFLKVLVGALSPERRSVANDSIVRRIQKPLFDCIGTNSPLHARASLLLATSKSKAEKFRSADDVEVVEALVSGPEVPSALHAITRDTAYKIVDWGRDVEFLAQANQISERALILQSLLPVEQVRRFFSGEESAWNPFPLEIPEKVFFLLHALETDAVTVHLIQELANVPPGTIIEARAASQMTCGALFRMLEDTEKLHAAKTVQEHRVALALALTMAQEVGAPIPPRWSRHAAQVRTSNDTKAALRKVSRPSGNTSSGRKTTKNADHQTIPRFEQLVDLGFLMKPDSEGPEPVASLSARRRWRYTPTDACRRWSAYLRELGISDLSSAKHSVFARVAIHAYGLGIKENLRSPEISEISQAIWRAYSAVGRSVGLTPVDSIAIRVMVEAAGQGVAIEMGAVHRFLLLLKERALLSETVLFAAGKSLETMYVRIKPTFTVQINEAIPALAKDWTI